MNDALEVVQALMCCACNNPDHHDAAAVLAAASGPWAEQLDAANADSPLSYRERLELMRVSLHEAKAELAAALARNAELEREANDLRQKVAYLQRRLEVTRETIHRQSEEQGFDGLLDQRDALRAELDNLRDRVNALADAEHSVEHLYETEELRYTGVVMADELRAIVRGSDDE